MIPPELYKIEYADEPTWRIRPRWRLYFPLHGTAIRVWWMYS